jgi:rare lipoprotein A
MYTKRWMRAALAACFVMVSLPCRADISEIDGPQAQIGLASYYALARTNMRTATGERENPNLLTAAHESLPLGSWVKVTNLMNGRSVTVRINDRKGASQTRIIDLSRRAAQMVGMMAAGLARVKIEPVKPLVKQRVAATGQKQKTGS